MRDFTKTFASLALTSVLTFGSMAFAKDPTDPSFSPDLSVIETLNQTDSSYSLVYRFRAISAGVTHELFARCRYGDYVTDSDYRSAAALDVHGPHHQDQRTIFYQSYRPSAGGNYEFAITVHCREG